MDSCPTLIYTLTYQAISLACNGCQFFATAGPTAWNSLPNPVCNTNEFSGAYKRSKCFCLHCTITLSALMESVYSLMRYTQTDQIATPRLCNTLPDDITSAPSLSVFRHKRNTFLFQKSYQDTLHVFCSLFCF